MITLNNESFAWDPLKIWLQAWTSHSGSCSPRCHHMIWGAPKKLLTEVDNYTNHFLRSRKKGKTHSKTPIFRNIEQIHRTGFPTHFFCSSLKFWHRGKLVGVTFDDVGPKNQILASYFSAPCLKYDSFHNEEICPGWSVNKFFFH